MHTLKFSLKFLGGVKPSFEIKRLDGSLFSGEADLNGCRLDYHELIVGMAPPRTRRAESRSWECASEGGKAPSAELAQGRTTKSHA